MTTRSMSSTSPSSNEAFTHPTDFIECLRELVAARPDDTALTVVAERNDHWIETVLSYREFAQRVHAVAATLQRLFAAGERILILLDNDEHYAVSMFACFHAGVIAVPVFPPESARPQHMARLAAIAVDALASGILTLSALKPTAATAAGQLGVSTVIAVDDIDRAAADTWRPHRPAPEDVAFLQYTSGSTSAPKGVMVTHANLMANERAIREGLAIGDDDIFGVWSPLFHDMGLIGGLLQPFYSGIPCVLSSPRFFLERPVRWLQLIARHHVTISGGPDFAYRLCLDRITDAQIDDIDLSSWRIAYTGAEPVRHDTMDAFSKRFASAGFAAGAVYPCYGLAEATLYVTGGQRGEVMIVSRFDAAALANREASVNDDGAALVGCGSAPSGHHVRIADPDTGDASVEGAIGEIWAAGPSIAAGYWNKPAATAETFVERDGHRWLRTGDLGFVHDGHLYVAGRLKDMIIVRGHNIYPHDIERVIEANVEAVRKGRVAAFAVTIDSVEGIGVAAEVSRGLQKLVPPQALVDAISAVVSEQCGDSPAVVVLLNPGALPKTSSGKLQRSACKKGWEKQALDAYAVFEGGRCVIGEGAIAMVDAVTTDAANAATAVSSDDDIAIKLSEVWRDLLGHDDSFRYASDAHFLALGGNSLAAVQLAARVSQHWHIAFTVSQVFEFPRLDAQAAAIRAQVQIGGAVPEQSIPVLSAERRAQPLPLSSAQQRQWFLWKVDPQGTAYHVLGALRLKGKVNVDAMRDAVSTLAQRHEALRTRFAADVDGNVTQVVHPAPTLELKVIDLQGVPPDERDVQSASSLRQALADPFDLIEGPLSRAVLIGISEEVYILVLAMHHIVSDGASMHILVNELGMEYTARATGSAPPSLPPMPVQYVDYAVWENEGGNDAERARQMAYWLENLSVQEGESQPVLSLPTDRPRTANAEYQGARFGHVLDEHLTAKLRQAVAGSNATLPMLLLSAFQVLLYRYSGQSDIRLGVPIANRTQPQIDRVVGFFVNTLVIRNVIDGNTSLHDMFADTRESMIGAQQHQSLPLEQLVEALNPERSAGHNPLFQVLFNYLQDDPRCFDPWKTVEIEQYELTPSDAQFDLTLQVHELPQGVVSLVFLYARNLFDADTVERMSSHYVALLHAFADQPTQALGDVDFLEESERKALHFWERDPREYPKTEPVHRLIERQAALAPDNEALRFADESISYAEMNERANRLAHYLVGQGVTPDTLVGVAMMRSPSLVISMLAIMKAGAAYVPLEPDYPADRIEKMLVNSGTRLTLTHGAAGSVLSSRAGHDVVDVDLLDLAGQRSDDPQIALHEENLAYVIFTSGSTGEPKAAANRHGALYNRLTWMQEDYALDASDSVLQKTPFSFDVSVWEFFWPLMTGARLVLAQPGEHRDPHRLVELIREHSVTTLHFVPSMLQAFLMHDGIEACSSLRRVICSGEALAVDLQKQVFRRLPDVELFNLYGPTEAAIDVTHWACRDDHAHHVPIGFPISNVVVRVLDDRLQQVPIGVAGELYLGGAGLARGYALRPGLSASRFVADPAALDGARLYRTGDRARWSGNGYLEYLGRLDHQVKIRGFRVELGDIEAHLLRQPEVQDAVVVLRDSQAGMQLVGYVSAKPGAVIDSNQLRERLGGLLPPYMVPAALVALVQMPVGANGKLDRNALPAPVYTTARAYTGPDGKVEERLTQIWASALGLRLVGVHDNFFDLGGHSLLLVKVHAAVEQAFSSGLSVVELFQYPTIRSLARRIEKGDVSESGKKASVRATGPRPDRRTALLKRSRSGARSRS